LKSISTRIWHLGAGGEQDEQAIKEAATLLREGGTVAFPTETVYGLGADARNTEAVADIFRAKGRPSDNPLIVHVAAISQLEELLEPWSELAGQLMERFWPGPLTLVLPARAGAVSPLVTAGLDTLGVRMPRHETALRLIAAAGCPVAAPSANRSGRPSPTAAAHVADDLAGAISGIVDDGPAGVGLESTVVELVPGGGVGGREAMRILRPGGVSAQELLEVGEVLEDSEWEPERQAPRSPGMKYRHYAPQGRLTVVTGDAERVTAHVRRELAEASRNGLRTGVLTYEEHKGLFEADLVAVCGSLNDLDTAARGLYAALRAFDAQQIESIWAEACPVEGIGAALMNRLLKAASGHIDQV